MQDRCFGIDGPGVCELDYDLEDGVISKNISKENVNANNISGIERIGDMLWYRILAMVLTSKAENNIKCYDGRLSKDNIELVRCNYIVFSSYYNLEGCVLFIPVFLATTWSSINAYALRQDAIPMLTLLIINYGHSIRCGDNYAKYSKKIHVITYSTNDRITYREAKDQAKLSGVDDASKMEDILTEVIRLGPCEIEWNYEIMIAILAKAYDIFSQESTLLEGLPLNQNNQQFLKLTVPIAIYGDIHGQYSDIWRWFHVNGWPPGTRTLFLGDYVDRGRHSTEVLMFVLLLKIVWPKSVFVCRGNHEEEQVNKAYNFYSELKARFPKSFRKLYRKVKGVFSMMPIACLISNQIICMHGGLSPRIQTVAEIAAIQRPLTKDNKEEVYIDILWSDPHPSKWKYEVRTSFKPFENPRPPFSKDF
ncbi:unnamed protein product [Haemonchus placei]|uniref:protein-serine/threonine phosphatase n=1 Tax=Haemonchus placei TaxID=6290 RepID=A0A158QJW3_HAEPC|nr:unnamed protein product [Haemonchus placei]